jgi:hypothetical protein
VRAAAAWTRVVVGPVAPVTALASTPPAAIALFDGLAAMVDAAS